MKVVSSLDRWGDAQSSDIAASSNGVPFRALVEHTQDVVALVDASTTLRYANPALKRALEYAPSKCIGERVLEGVHPGDRARVGAALRDLLAESGQTRRVQARLRHRDGTWCTFECVAKSVAGPAGSEAKGSDGTQVVVTAREGSGNDAVEGALRALHERNEVLMEAIPDAIVHLGPDGRYRHVKAPRDFDWLVDPEALIGRRPRDVLPEALAERLTRCNEEVMRTGQTQTVEYEVQIDGERHTREARVVPYGAGEVVSILRDVTGAKQAEQRLREQEALLRGIVTNIPVMLFVVDADGTITLSEGRGLRKFGREPGEMVGQSALALDHVPGMVDHLRRALEGEEVSAVMSVEGYVFEYWYAPLAGDDGHVEKVVCVAADVTESRQAHKRLKRSREQLRRLAVRLQRVREEERTRIAREVHDVLGQALTALRMDVARVERLAERGPDALGAHTDEMAERIEGTIEAVRRISTELRPGVLDDLGLCAALEWQLEKFEERTGIHCAFDSDAEAASRFGPDRSTAVFRIFQELLTNVSRHADASRVDVHLREGKEEMDRDEKPGSAVAGLVLAVRDDGRGIRPGDVDSNDALGLLGIRERLALWNGEARFDGQPGEGTTVTVFVPKNDGPEGDSAPPLGTRRASASSFPQPTGASRD
jgi:PAS domain S-box-containing protein